MLKAKLVCDVCKVKAKDHEARHGLQGKRDHLHLEHWHEQHGEEEQAEGQLHQEAHGPRQAREGQLHRGQPEQAQAVEDAREPREGVVHEAVRLLREGGVALGVHELRHRGQVVRQREEVHGEEEQLAEEAEAGEHLFEALLLGRGAGARGLRGLGRGQPGAGPPGGLPEVEGGLDLGARLQRLPGHDEEVVHSEQECDDGVEG
mmetsp:Transcript_42709/g.132178  ORF Transcript_42709/g.132178 Transcript_42709/m.132178 type:complete len:204 (+) Transcript_42709:259-870(+)